MQPNLELVHHRPGRLRVRSDALCEATDEASASRIARIRDAVGGVHGVRSVAHNARSGSILVEYVPGDVEPDAVIEAIGHAAGLELAVPSGDARARGPSIAERVIAAARELDAATAALTGGKADLRTLVPGAMVGLAAISFVVKKDRLPRWDNLAYWAFALFHGLHSVEREGARDRRDAG
jgi:hypothetical protein